MKIKGYFKVYPYKNLRVKYSFRVRLKENYFSYQCKISDYSNSVQSLRPLIVTK